MIYEINIVLMVLVGILLVATLSKKKEGFNEFNFEEDVYIPYVSQDVICLILLGAGVQNINKYGIIIDKCTRDKKKTVPDTSNTCTS
jgi:hypothetical protein